MRVKKIQIRNILGIEELDIEPGDVTLIEGRNAEGKSSVLEALKTVIGGGHDATLVRQGAEEGEVVMVLEDGVEMRKRITATRASLDVEHPTMGKVSAPQTWLNGITDELSVNPVEFLTTDDRVGVLLEAMPVEVDVEALREAMEGLEETGEIEVDGMVAEVEGRHALEAIEQVHSRIYDARTGVNRIVRESRTTAEKLRQSLPAEGADPEEVEEELREAERRHRDAEKELARETERIDTRLEKKVGEVRSEAAAEVEELQARIQQVKDEAQEEIEELRESAEEEKDELLMERRPEVNRLGGQVSALRERLETVKEAEGTRCDIQRYEQTAEEKDEVSERLTTALNRLDGLKSRLLEDLPIEGAEIRDGRLLVDGIRFERLNSARQARIAVEVAKMRAGDLGLVLVDNMELLDSETFEEFREALQESGLQAVVTRVTDSGLTVSTNGADQ